MNFLFDIGNVLLLLDFPAFEKAVFPGGIPPEVWSLKEPYETGKISNEEFIAKALQFTTEDLSREELTAAWQDIFRPHPPMWELIKRLKQQDHTLILFSNTNALHAEYFLPKYDIFENFQHHHFSHEVGALKPDPDFYTIAIKQYGLTPAETLYLDDLAENIATGKALGFLCHQYDFNEHQEALAWLESLT